jgi:outer membrane receptor for ferrienterochelin and colicins
MKKKFLNLLIISALSNIAYAQNNCQNFIIQDTETKETLIGASVQVLGSTRGAQSDLDGKAIICNLSENSKIVISYVGYKSDTLNLTKNSSETLTILLHQAVEMEEEVIISATRTGSRVEDAAAKIEVLGAADMQEENGIKPGNVASILGDISSIQIQQSSAVSGNAAVRMFGLGSKYTQLMRDGMPAFDGLSGGFGVLQIAPLDLKQIEIIKGSSSTLYGGGAIGGIINFVSKSPSEKAENSLTLNISSLGESNANVYISRRKEKFGVTFFGGVMNQLAKDVNKDGFSDVANSQQVSLHPRVFYYPNKQSEVIFGVSGTVQNINGGDMIALKTPSTTHPFFEKNKLHRGGLELQYKRNFDNKNVFQIKGAINAFGRTQTTPSYVFDATQAQSFAEVNYLIKGGKNNYVFGANISQKQFNNLTINNLGIENFNQTTIGTFAQASNQFTEKLRLESGLRLDYNLTYRAFALPSLALLYKITTDFSTRLNLGMGYQLPDPFASQTKDYDISKIQAIPSNIKAERAYSSAAEWTWKHLYSNELSVFLNQTFFAIQVQKPIQSITESNGNITLQNASGNINTLGVDNYVRLGIPHWEAYLGYTLTVPKKTYEPAQPYVTYTPTNRAAATLVYEPNEDWRLGLEASYTGAQHREDGSHTKGFAFVAAMIGYHYKQINIVANVENLLDARQTRYESIVLPPLSHPTFKTLWAPIDGRVANLSLKWVF